MLKDLYDYLKFLLLHKYLQYTKTLVKTRISYLRNAVAFTLTPINTTVCSKSTVQFVCSATDVTIVSYSLNSKPIPPLPPNVYISASTVIGGARIVNMSISNASANGVITCRAYLVNGTVLTRTAYLTVQGTGRCAHMYKCIESHISGPPSPTTNLTITTYNDTATILVWGPPSDAQSPSLLSYAVVIRNGSGAPVYSETVREPQLIINTPDPCGHYEATVTPICGSITGAQTSPVKLGELPPSISHDQVHTSLVFLLSPSDNVTVNISVPVFGMMCSYTMVAASGFEVLSFSHVKLHSVSHEKQPTIIVSLPPNKHFNLTITAYNGYGKTSTAVVITTFDVVGVSVNSSSPMGLVCLFNTGSLAKGCLVYLTDTDTGVYSVEVYDIERDGSVSSVPALAGEIVTVFGPSTVNGPSVEDGHHVTSYPLTTSNAVYGIVVKCSDDPTTADNPVYGARIDTTMETR
ncbi:hypothetical protein EMCRGX_G017518 [Ephydatia muelleri]